MPVLFEREHRTDSAHRDRLSFEIDRAIENLNGRHQPARVARHQAQLVPKPRIVMIVTGEKLAPIVVPMAKQVEHLIPLAVVRSPNFHSSGFVTYLSGGR